MLASLPKAERDAWLDRITPADAERLRYDWSFNARPEQKTPDGDWDIWMLLAGRGFGKTETGAQWVREQVDAGVMSIALIAETQKDLEEVMVSRLISIYPEDERPKVRYKPVRITWPNGAVALGYNATEPDQLRGPQFEAAWSDEVAKWKRARDTWDMLQFALRLGKRPRQLVTTTPRPIELIKSILAGKEGKVAVTRGRTDDNAANLAASFLTKIKARYEGTRLGRQELNAEVLGDLPGALWTLASIDAYRTTIVPEMKRIVVAVDPAVTDTEESDDHGIIVAGTVNEEGYVLDDASIKGSPNEWARRAISCYRTWAADCIVVEVNQGGDMVANTIRTIDPRVPIREVRATRGKHVRAEPVSALYEQGKVKHVGSFPELEDQMTQMTPDGFKGKGSPDRVDALVWAMTELFPAMTIAPPKPVVPIPPRIGLGAQRAI